MIKCVDFYTETCCDSICDCDERWPSQIDFMCVEEIVEKHIISCDGEKEMV